MAALTIASVVHALLAAQFGVKPDRVTPEADLVADLGAESLDLIEIVMELEERFGIEIPDNEIAVVMGETGGGGPDDAGTVGAIVRYLESRHANVHHQPYQGKD